MRVRPDRELNRIQYREDGRFVLIPFSSVVAIKDYIVIDESRAVMDKPFKDKASE